ncbi:hypothetical protein KCP76_00595 [Salmonella enterica subsp. enterica serovar Weltevreden]|nr:hypothetical protein KCP76_00595 [Salmonella enterica subsp. enterica serovar Weltevreden]
MMKLGKVLCRNFLLLGAATLQVTTGVMQYGYPHCKKIWRERPQPLSLADQGICLITGDDRTGEWQYYPGEGTDRSYITSIRGLIRKMRRLGRLRYISACYDGHPGDRCRMNTAARLHCNTEKCVVCDT